MTTAPELAREIGRSRRADARESAFLAAARLARRERRIRHRLERINSQLAGQRSSH